MKMEKQETAKTIAGHDVKRVHEKISDYLVRSEYDYICVINTQTGMLYVDTDELHADWDWTGEEHDYYDARALLVETFLDDNDGKDFMHCSEIPYIVKQLEEQKVYSFMFHFSTPEHNRHKKQWKFSYLDQEDGLILTTLKDVTKLLEQDHLTGELNRYGFIRKARVVLRDPAVDHDLAIMYINLKGFKAINELFGTEGGDLALREVVRVIHRSNLHPYAVGRIEADHFVCLVDPANINYEHLKQFLHQTLVFDQRSLDVYGVCGIYMIPAEERLDSVSKCVIAPAWQRIISRMNM